MSNEVQRKLLDFVSRSFMVPEDEIDLDSSLIDQGVIDSFGLVEITTFIEQELGVAILEEEMTREAFGSMNKMVAFISRRLEAGHGD